MQNKNNTSRSNITIYQKELDNYNSLKQSLSKPKLKINLRNNNTITYDDKGRMASFGNKTILYVNFGNTTSKGSNIKYGYTRGCLLTTFTNSSNNISLSFSYNYNGIRQSKTANNSNTHTFYYDNSNRLLFENTSEGLIEYIYSGNSLIGAIFNGRKFRYIKNILGDIIEIRNESGEIICGYSYDSFGNNELYDYTNSQSNIYDRKFVDLNPFRYRGYYYDQESCLYYLINRYYDPETHRFLTIDSFEYLDIESIGGIDLYQYCNNNPVMYADEDGNVPILTLIIAGTFALGFGSSLFMNAVTNNWQLDWRDFLQAGVDGAFAVGATMLAMTGIGFAGSIAAGAAMGWSQYAIGVGIQGDSITLAGSLTAIGIGALGGAISGAGAANSANIGKNMIGLSDDGVRAIGAITNAANRKAAGIISAKGLQATLNLYGKTAFNAVQAAIPGTMRRLFLSSARKIALYTVLANASQSGLNYGYKAWGLI